MVFYYYADMISNAFIEALPVNEYVARLLGVNLLTAINSTLSQTEYEKVEI